MANSITDTYKMKREILHFSKKFSACLSSPEAKFTADMIYGIVASKSCLLTQISQRLQENTKKRYTVDRLSDHHCQLFIVDCQFVSTGSSYFRTTSVGPSRRIS